jgi:hypothetical protein
MPASPGPASSNQLILPAGGLATVAMHTTTNCQSFKSILELEADAELGGGCKLLSAYSVWLRNNVGKICDMRLHRLCRIMLIVHWL